MTSSDAETTTAVESLNEEEKLKKKIRRLHGWRVAILSGIDAYEKAIHLAPKHKIPLVNGDVDCHLLIYEIE